MKLEEEWKQARAQMNESNGLIFSLFTKFDHLKLFRHVGEHIGKKMVTDEIKETWEF